MKNMIGYERVYLLALEKYKFYVGSTPERCTCVTKSIAMVLEVDGHSTTLHCVAFAGCEFPTARVAALKMN
jgi:hypothetical protein